MKKVLLISGIGGAGLAAVGAGVGISASLSSSTGKEKPTETIEEPTRETNFDNSSNVSSHEEDKNLSESTEYKTFQEKLKEIEKIVGNSNISQKVAELKEIIDSFKENLPTELEEEFYKWKNTLREKFKGNEELLTEVLNHIQKKSNDYQKITKDKEEEL